VYEGNLQIFVTKLLEMSLKNYKEELVDNRKISIESQEEVGKFHSRQKVVTWLCYILDSRRCNKIFQWGWKYNLGSLREIKIVVAI